MSSVPAKVVVELGADVIVFGGKVPDGPAAMVEDGPCVKLELGAKGAPGVDVAAEEDPAVDDEPNEAIDPDKETLSPKLAALLPDAVAERPVLPPEPVNEMPLGAEVEPDALVDPADPVDDTSLGVELGVETPLPPLLLLLEAVPPTPVLPPDPVNDIPLGAEDEPDADWLLEGKVELGDPLAPVLLAESEVEDKVCDEERDGLYVDVGLPTPGSLVDALASPVPVVSCRLLPPVERIPTGGTGEDDACSNAAL